MNERAQRIAALSPKQRALLEKRRKARAPGAGAPAIPRRQRPGPTPLSFAQERLWFLDQLDPGGSAYNVAVALRLAGVLRSEVLRASIDRIVRRHEVLRTTFTAGPAGPLQVVHPPAARPLPAVDLRGLDPKRRGAETDRLLRYEARRPFDLEQGPLARSVLLEVRANEHLALFVLHHIVSDGWSTGILVREVARLYRAALEGVTAGLDELPVQYADFALWQRRRLEGEVLESQVAYWRSQLAGVPMLELPADRPRPNTSSQRGGELSVRLDAALAEGLARRARGEGATLFMVLLAGFSTLLGRLSDQRDVAVGSPVAGRGQLEIEGLIGFFVNTLVFRADLGGEPSFGELLGRLRQVALDAYAHQDVPFEKLVQELRPERLPGATPFFQAVLVLQNAPMERLELPGLAIDGLPLSADTAKFDLTLTFTEKGPSALDCSLEYSRDLYDATTVGRWSGYLTRLLRAAVSGPPDLSVGDLPLLAEAERHQLLESGRAAADTDVGELVHHAFARRAVDRPAAIAVHCGGEEISYGELDRRANRLARFLLTRGVGRGRRVALSLDRCSDTATGILATFKAGAAYVPMDPAYPEERLRFMLEDAEAALVLTRRSRAGALAGAAVPAVDLDDQDLTAFPAADPEVDLGPSDAAYVIYTSGSTGPPKGVVVGHGQIARLFSATEPWFSFGPEDVSTLFHSAAFDFSVWEIWGALARGGRLVVVPFDVSRSPGEFRRLLSEERVTVLNQTPSAFRQLMAADAEAAGDDLRPFALRLVIFGGEALDLRGLRPWRERYGERPRLVNMYGITETTVHVTYRPLSDDDLRRPSGSVIGRPIPDLSFHVLDRGLEPTPVRVAGEIAVGGAGLAQGYLGRASLTAQRFVPDPFSESPGERLYRSGDLARRLGDGDLEYLGRIDHQVKLRGFRIELGEIETRLADHPAVAAAVVVLRQERGDARLVAYAVPAAPRSLPSREELYSHLRTHLPNYMVPAVFVALEALPLTPNGKVDRRALPEPEILSTASSRPPRTPQEELLIDIWRDVLGVEGIGVDDDFFELGGHSLAVTRLRSRLVQTFGVEIPVRRFFQAATVAGLAAEVEAAAGSKPPLPIVSAPRDAPLPLSYAQERLWFLDRLDPGGSAYNIPMALRLTGTLSLAALRASIDSLVRRHEALRTTVLDGGGRPRQLVHPASPSLLTTLDLRGLDPPRRNEVAARVLEDEARRPFDLERGPLLRALVARLADGEHRLLFVVHHIVADGWSIGILVRDVAALYRAALQGSRAELPELPVQYADYAFWQRRSLEGEVLAGQIAYWRGQLAGVPVLELPADRPRPAAASQRGAEIPLHVDGALADRLRSLARAEAATLFMVLAAGFSALLGRLAGQKDVAVGTPFAGRGRLETEGLIGFFVNTLVLRADLGGNPGFSELVRRQRRTVLDAYAHQDVPFAKLVEVLQPERLLGTTPFFQAMLVHQDALDEPPALPGLETEELPVRSGTAKLDLTWTVVEVPGSGFAGSLEYGSGLFEATRIQRLAGHLRRVLETVAEEPSRRLPEIDLLTPGERRQLLAEWNDTVAVPPAVACLHHFFERQAEWIPDAVAVLCERRCLTYGELEEAANRLANRLRRLGVEPETVVGVLLERSLEMVVALYAVLKAGGAYLPLDPSYPPDRLRFFAEDAAPRLVLTLGPLAELAPSSRPALLLDAEAAAIAAAGSVRPAPGARADNLAYVIYTSGSTGRPKGVMNTHRGIVNRIAWMQSAYRLGGADRVLQKTPFSFDVSVWELFWPLAVGARLVMARPEGHKDPSYLVEAIAAEGVTTLHFVPSMLRAFLENGTLDPCRSVRRTIVSGEELTTQLGERFQELLASSELHNLYGPTEAAVDVTAWPCQPEEVRRETRPGLSIGRPIANLRIHLLEWGGSPAPVGVDGELAIGGVGVGRGYRSRPGLTAERFVPDPFAPSPGDRLYRTGDLARRRGDGKIDFLGRLDHQVKLRGFRIELGEIESTLREVPTVRDAVVTVRELGRDRGLVAYLVSDGGPAPENGDPRELLRARLPEYMVPSVFVRLAELPLTPSGKVDRRRLPAPGPGAPKAGAAAPRTPAEELLAGIWAEVLDRPDIGVEDDFFTLGGHSLLAVQVVSRIRQVFGLELSVRSLFETPTIAGLAGLLNLAEKAAPASPALVRVARDQPLPLSFGQERLWFLHQLDPHAAAYNMPFALRAQGRFDANALIAACRGIARRHEVLRTRYRSENEGPVATLLAEPAIPFLLVDMARLCPSRREAALHEVLRGEASRPFGLVRETPMRVLLARLAPDEHGLFVNLHHIAADGWSLAVLVREALTLYRAAVAGETSPLAPLPIQYVDYAVWQRRWLAGEGFENQLAWWRKELAGAPQVLDLPTDRPRPAAGTHAAGSRSFTLSPELVGALGHLAREHGVTLFMALLAACQSVLFSWTGQRQMLLGSPVAGRTHRELEDLIGFFVNTLVLRAEVAPDLAFSALLGHVRSRVLDAFARQEVPFERLVESSASQRDATRPPFVQVMLALQNAPREIPRLPELELSEIPVATPTAKFDLTLTFQVEDRPGYPALRAVSEHDADLFDDASVDRLLRRFERSLRAVAADPHVPVGAVAMSSGAERHQLLVELNDAERSYPRQAGLWELFGVWIERSPDAIAVVGGDDLLSFSGLAARSRALADRLRQIGVRPGERVGLVTPRDAGMPVAVLGIVAAGASYVPLDPEYPAERLVFMADDSGLAVVVAGGTVPEPLARRSEQTVIRLEELPASSEGTALQGTALQGTALQGTALPGTDGGMETYVIYTSGSTGRPKGVMVPHRGVSRLALGVDYLRLGAGKRMAQISNISFDAATLELWPPLLTGGRLELMARDQVLAPARFGAELRRRRIDHLFLTTALFHQVAQEAPAAFAELETLLFGGEAADPVWVSRVLAAAPRCRVVNVYGPTENTALTTWFPVSPRDLGTGNVPIGRPITHNLTYVLDARLCLAPVGATGELCIGGDGLAFGYLNRPGSTAAAFVPNPHGRPGTRLYRSGDRVRLLHRGEIEFLGRFDHQVKIRGFRVELGEIETALLAHPDVTQGVVVFGRHEDGQGRLAAYAAGRAGVLTPQALRSFLEDRLPAFMVPSFLVVLDALPLTPNGKIDRRALPAPQAASSPRDIVAPRTPTEELLAAIWCDVLGLEAVGIGDDFFALGGHSLLATKVAARIRKTFGVDLALRHVFEASSLAALAAHVEHRSPAPRFSPISPAPRDRPLPLSFGQERLWFLDQLEPSAAAYNIPWVLRLRGPLDPARLRRALDTVVGRHEVLRTTFEVLDEAPVQVVGTTSRPFFSTIDLTRLAASESEAEARRAITVEERRPFDLRRGPLLRTFLLRLSSWESVLAANLHHIVCDEWSMNVLVSEISRLYLAAVQGVEPRLDPLPVQYADFAAWQRSQLASEVIEPQLAYWRECLQGAPRVLGLPLDHPRPAVLSHRGALARRHLAPRLCHRLRELGLGEGVTLFMTFLGAWFALLSRWSGQGDLIVGSPIANRRHAETDGLIGFFLNTLALRCDLSGDPVFSQLLGTVRSLVFGAHENQDLPFEKLVEHLGVERDPGRNPLFQVMFTFLYEPASELRFPGIEVEPFDVDRSTTKFDLTLRLAEEGGGVHAALEYDADLFDATTAHRLIEHYVMLLEGIAGDASRALTALPVLSPAQLHQIRFEWNDSPVPQPVDGDLAAILEAQARRIPEATALVCREQRMSYGELDRGSNRLAHELLGRGLVPGQAVGIGLDRSLEMVTAVFAALKTGGCYVPIDPHSPWDRVQSICEDARLRFLLTNRAAASSWEVESRPATAVLCLEREAPAIARRSATAPPRTVYPESTAYVLYTSGSTGRPKGVVVEHRQALSYLAAVDQRVGFRPGASFAMVQPLIVDSCKTVLYPWSARGGSLHLLAEDMALDPHELGRYFTRHRIDVLKIAPTHFAVLGSACLPAGQLILGGEASRLDRVAELSGNGTCRVFNHYGPTETTVGVTAVRIAPWHRTGPSLTTPIGRPLAGVRTSILDRRFHQVPPGATGELLIGGSSVSRGYLLRPKLTAERFVPEPLPPHGEPGRRVYRTGDLARALSDGRLEFLGRIDHQIKVLGFRVEPGEIEAALLSHRAVAEALVVSSAGGEARQRLLAYVVRRPGAELTARALRAHLRERLPKHMVPAALTFLQAFPRTPHGKVDRRALPAAEEDGTAPVAVRGPRDLYELRLIQIWEELLERSRIHVDDHFFELGGHSILAVRLLGRIEQTFGLTIPLARLFEAPTIAQLAAVLRRRQTVPEIERCLVQILPGGPRTPVFWLHPIGGSVLCYFKLSQALGNGQPIYGLQSAGLLRHGIAETSIERMAGRYLREMRQVQPKGPYTLGGWSMGGAVAFELACQLRSLGEDVDLLALLDVAAPRANGHGEEPPDEKTTIVGFLRDLALLNQVDAKLEPLADSPGETLEDFLGAARTAALLPTGLETARVRQLLEVYRANARAVASFMPRPYPGRLVFLRSEVTAQSRPDLEPTWGWAELAGAGTDVYVVPGDHYALLSEPLASAWAEPLKKALART